MSRKKEAPKTCDQCGTKLPANGRCVKAAYCDQHRKNNEALNQKIRALEAKK
jgi:hypothetical protein